MTTVNRRDFIKTVGLSSTAAVAAACSVDPVSWDPMVPFEYAYPYVVQPEEVVPGVASYFATQIRNGIGVLARVREGRVVSLQGNPQIPMSSGRLDSISQSAILDQYAADRFSSPRKGSSKGDWESTIKEIGAAVKAGKRVGWIGKYRSGASAKLVKDFVKAKNGDANDIAFWEPGGKESLVKAAEKVYGQKLLPSYKLANAKTVVSFGADFLHSWGDNLELAKGWADGRDPGTPAKAENVAYTYTIGSRIGASSANTDKHIAVNPGSEGALALAIAKRLAKGKNSKISKLLSGVNDVEAIKASGAKESLVAELIDRLQKGHGVALPGDTEAGTNQTDLVVATYLINEIVGDIKGNSPTVVFGENLADSISSAQDVLRILSDASNGKIDVLFVEETNLVYHFPATSAASADVGKKLGSVKTLIFLDNEPSDSHAANSNAYILPTGTELETWGASNRKFGHYSLRQPVMKTQEGLSVRQIEDVLLTISKNIGLVPVQNEVAATPVSEDPTEGTEGTEGSDVSSDNADTTTVENTTPNEGSAIATDNSEQNTTATETTSRTFAPLPNIDSVSFTKYISSYWESVVYPESGSKDDFKKFWIASLQLGGFFGESGNVNKSLVLTSALSVDSSVQASSGNGAYSLVAFPHPKYGHGQHAGRSWLQEIPDPLSGFSWGTWIEVNPKTAEKIGLTKNKGAILKVGSTSLNVGWFGSPGIKEDTVAIVLGNGHDEKSSPRYARMGSNANTLFGHALDKESGAVVYQSVKADVSVDVNPNAPSPQNELLKSDTLTRNGRGVNFTAGTDDLGKGGKPGSIVPAHHLPKSSMAVMAAETIENSYAPEGKDGKKAKLTDMFPEPEHPTYRFALNIDLNKCTGCGACEVACMSENNIPVVGPEQVRKSRRMSWIRMSRYWEGDGENPDVRFQPVMCQHCSHAPCEGVCPVLATYHNLDGLNAMIYNRCVGTRYCGNNCPYSARRFNYHTYRWPDSFNMMLNPDVIPREMGVMEKCTFCVQKTRYFKDAKRDKYGFVGAQKIQNDDAANLLKLTACASACPSDAITFGNKNDENSEVAKAFKDPRSYLMLAELNNKPGVNYMARIVHGKPRGLHHGDHGSHGGDHGGSHGEDHGSHDAGHH